MKRIITLTERKATEAARRAAAVGAILPLLAAYAREHGGRFLLFGSAARGQMKFHSDVDLLTDFPSETLNDAWQFAEQTCWDHDLEPDLMPYRWCKPAFLEDVATDLKDMSDGRWFEIDTAITAAVRNFTLAGSFYAKIAASTAPEDRILVEMALMHAMQSGHTSLEVALVHILELCGEAPPTGATWHADLIRRTAAAFSDRPAILDGAAARAADLTRRFRNIAAQAYDTFDYTEATEAVASAATLASLLPSEIARFRQAIDP